MADGFFFFLFFSPFDFNVLQAGGFYPSNGSQEKQETELRCKEDDCLFRMEVFGDFNLYEQNISKIEDQANYQQCYLDCLILDELLFSNDDHKGGNLSE